LATARIFRERPAAAACYTDEMRDRDDQYDQGDPTLPDPLRAELSRVFRADASVPPTIDQTILNRARAHLWGFGRRRLLLRTAGAAAAVAATIAIAVWIVHPGPRHVATVAEDTDGDGVVDIRDALALQRAIDAGLVKGHDINRDGVTDRRDVDAIAQSVVRLDRGTAR
jgi:hypothetical protein